MLCRDEFFAVRYTDLVEAMADDLSVAGEALLRAVASVRAALLLAGGTLTSWLALSALLASVSRPWIRAGICLAISSAWLVIYSIGRLESASVLSKQTEAWECENIRASDLNEVPNCDISTDRGRKIHLYSPSIRTLAKLDPSINSRPDRLLGFRDWTIELAPADAHTNCHGWLFAGGKGLIDNHDVDQILDDNGYYDVETPVPGDIIVYRAEIDNSIVHTGLIKVATHDGIVLVESKWGYYGRFLHQPKHQAYSQKFRVLRSPRDGHELAGVPGLGPSPIPQSNAKRL